MPPKQPGNGEAAPGRTPEGAPEAPMTIEQKEARRSEIANQLVNTENNLTTEQRQSLLDERDQLFKDIITEEVTTSVERSVKRSITELKNELGAQLQTRQQENADLQEKIQDMEDQRAEREEIDRKNKLNRTIKLIAGAVGFAVAFSTPVGWGIALAAGGLIGSKLLAIGARKGEEKLAEYDAQIANFASRIRKVREAMQQLPENNANRIIGEAVMERDQQDVDKLQNKRKWVNRLTMAATYGSPALSGFGIGAGLGTLAKVAITSAVDKAVDAKLAATTGQGGAAGAPTGTGIENAQASASVMGTPTTPGIEQVVSNPYIQNGHLNVPGAWNGTTLAHASPETMLSGGLNNFHNYAGSIDGMTGAKFAEAAAKYPVSIFQGAGTETGINVTRILNAMKANTDLSFAKAYESVMNAALPALP